MHDISTYARMLEASWATIRNQKTIDGIRYDGSSEVLVAKARDIHMDFEFLYKGKKVDDCGGFCAWVDPYDEMARLIKHFDLTQGQEGEIVCICKLIEDWHVIDQGALLSDHRYVKWSAPYVEDLTAAIRKVDDYATNVILDEVVWSTNWGDGTNEESLERAKAMFEADGSTYKQGNWEEKLVAMAKDGGAQQKALAHDVLEGAG